MKIPNPWPDHSHICCVGETVDGVEYTSVSPAGPDLEVPDGIIKAVLTPIASGHSQAPAVGKPRVWTEALGIVTPEEYVQSFGPPMVEMDPPEQEPEPETEEEPEPETEEEPEPETEEEPEPEPELIQMSPPGFEPGFEPEFDPDDEDEDDED